MILPVCPIPGPSKQSAARNDGLISYLEKVGCLGPVLLRCSSEDISGSAPLLGRCLSSSATCMVGGLKADDDELAKDFLDQGASVAFFDRGSRDDSDEAQEETVLRKRVLNSFPRNRMGIVETYKIDETPYEPVTSKANMIKAAMKATLATYCEDAMSFVFEIFGNANAWKTDDIGTLARKTDETEVLMHDIADFAKELVKAFEASNPGDSIHIYLQHHFEGLPATAPELVAYVSTVKREAVHAVVNTKIMSLQTTDKPLFSPYSVEAGGLFGLLQPDSSHLVDIAGAYIKSIVTDRPDGMYTTVVNDENGKSLGLVYSNDESVRTAIFEGKGIYWSRSRKGLWRKGDTSGHHQSLLAIDLDCDGDALRFTVFQHGSPGSFCHLNRRNCWGEDTGFTQLQTVLQDRLKSAPQGSYTKRLFNDPDLLQKKLLEEVQELVEAKEHDHIAEEAADVMYFMMVRCAAAGVTLNEIEKQLDKRSLKVSRRPGNAKEWRSANAAKLLKAEK